MGSVRLQNVYLRTKDMHASRSFYEKLLGVPPSFVDGDHWTQYKLGGVNFALAGEREQSVGTSDTVAVIEVEDLAEVGRAAVGFGGKVLGRRDMGVHGEVLTVADPSGVVIQFFARRAVTEHP
jgi:predicted enzyme related to lactoylglutathione lyase